MWEQDQPTIPEPIPPDDLVCPNCKDPLSELIAEDITFEYPDMIVNTWQCECGHLFSEDEAYNAK